MRASGRGREAQLVDLSVSYIGENRRLESIFQGLPAIRTRRTRRTKLLHLAQLVGSWSNTGKSSVIWYHFAMSST
jgi:hypothetical protein